MPRERIQHGQMFVSAKPDDKESWKPYKIGDAVPDDALLREEPSLDVSWRREDAGGWVQIGFDAPRDWWERFFASYAGSPDQHHFAAWTTVMERQQINHMIRTLRRARDAAYGSDE